MTFRYLPIALIVAGLVAAYACGVRSYLSLDYLYDSRLALKAFVGRNGVASAFGFFLFYAIAIAFVFPAPLILTIAGGFLFGWWMGGLLSLLAASLGGTLLFLATRSAFGGVLQKKAKGPISRFAAGFRRDAFTYLLVLRLTPVLPVAVLNIGPAVLGVPLRAFTLATLLGMAPGAMVYAFLGSGLDRALKIAGKRDHLTIGDLMAPELMMALGGLAALSIGGLCLRRWVLRADAPHADASAARLQER